MIHEASASGTRLEPAQNEETPLQHEKKANFDINESTQNATIIDSSDNPYYEGLTVDIQK